MERGCWESGGGDMERRLRDGEDDVMSRCTIGGGDSFLTIG